MKNILKTTIIASLFLFVLQVNAQTKKPVNIIYDTDIDLDVDDVGALAILHAMEDNGDAKILGVICNAPTPYGATTIAAINDYYGKPSIPIGDMPINDYVYDKSFSKRYRNYEVETPYGNFNLPLFKRFDSHIKSRKDVWDGVKLYRKLLAEADDNSVTIAAVGLVTVLEDLMYSKPDEYSKLNGLDLIKKKVNQLVCMAGTNTPRPGKYDFNWGFDGRNDIERVTKDWPTKMVISPLGGKIFTGERLNTETPEDNPVRQAFELFLSPRGFKSRPTWDEIAVYYAVKGTDNLFGEKFGQRLQVTDNPLTYTWREKKKNEPEHVVLTQIASTETIVKVIDDLMVQPPKAKSVK